MIIPSTRSARILYAFESVWGQAPSPLDMKAALVRAESLTQNKTTQGSNRTSSAHSEQDLRETYQSVSGSLNFDWRIGASDDFIRFALRSIFQSLSVSGIAVNFNAEDSSVSSAEEGIFENLFIGQWVKVAGSIHAQNNGFFKILARDGESITLDAQLADETTSLVTISGNMIRNGVINHSLCLERQIVDAGQYYFNSGLLPSGLNLDIPYNGEIEAQLQIAGKSQSLNEASQALEVLDPHFRPPP